MREDFSDRGKYPNVIRPGDMVFSIKEGWWGTVTKIYGLGEIEVYRPVDGYIVRSRGERFQKWIPESYGIDD